MKNPCKKPFSFFLSACLFFIFSATLLAQSSVISYNGRLLDSAGNVVNSSGLPMKFLIYSDLTGGALLYQDWHDGSDADHPLVPVHDGLYKVKIGDDTTNHGGATYTSLVEALKSDDSVFLQIIIDGISLSPREQLYSHPFALTANFAGNDYANKALDNLEDTVQIPTALKPKNDDSIDLGSDTKAFKNFYLKGNLSDGTETRSLTNIGTVSGPQTWTNKTIDATLNTIILDDSKILIGNAANSAQGQSITGDIAISNTGVATIQPDAVTNAKMADNSVDSAEFANDAVTTSKIQDKNVTLAKFADGGANQVLTTDASGAAQWQNKTIFVSSVLPLNQIYAGDATNTATAMPNLPPQALPTGGNWNISSNLNIDSNTLVVDQTNDRVGVGVAAPTAVLHLKAGTATANSAPLKFTSGTDLTTAEDGAFEFGGGALKFTRDLWKRKDFAYADAPPPITVPTQFSYFYDDFDEQVTTAMVWTANNATGTQAVATITSTDNTLGIIQFSTGAAAAGRSCLQKSATGFVLGVNAFHCETRARIVTLSTATQEFGFAIGLHDDIVLNPVDGIYFLYDRLNYGTNWQCVTSSNSTRTVANSGIAIVANTWYRLGFTVNATGTAVNFYINGNRVATITTNIPTGSGRVTGPRILLLKSAGTTARTAQVDYWLHKIVYTNPR